MRVFLGIFAAIAAILVGAYFYLSVPEIPRATLEAKYATPPSQFLALKDVPRVHYRDQGPKTAPVLVLLHGMSASLFTWEPWVARLGDTYRIVTIDMPAHGLTGATGTEYYSQKGMAEFVDAVTDKIGLKKFAIGGNSMGGGVAARFAEMYPERVTALILIDAGGMPAKAGDHVPIGFRLLRTPVLNKLLVHMAPRSMFAEGLHDAFNHENLVTPQMIDQYQDFARMEGTPEAMLVRAQMPFGDSYIKDHAGDIKAPTLILWGAKDHLIPVAAAYEYQKAIPGSKLIVYPDGGHVLQEDEADKSAADAKAFLTSVLH
ncbi:MAG TPA: alpha/beta hydrolase [Rhizomicrobium sp.]|nr:alpha/beta hydrolase [Rhizomicrobium sp.]